jgi:hypothetical protein
MLNLGVTILFKKFILIGLIAARKYLLKLRLNLICQVREKNIIYQFSNFTTV